MSPAPFTGEFDPALLFALRRMDTLDRVYLLSPNHVEYGVFGNQAIADLLGGIGPETAGRSR